ncbi:hypothetical protein [Flavobacterium phage FLiP]|uniref:Uncharacterized protein n=1 Tax=Flavobacterium phage FLiP TaxID=2023716 RepID=A0A222NP91_9VIRU|nr:hypothetical protein HOR88_gp01 [Flavobacterium phage FLiP]ASQ41222.1 hypothetical protein [Flavobacterium phage FLiP]
MAHFRTISAEYLDGVLNTLKNIGSKRTFLTSELKKAEELFLSVKYAFENKGYNKAFGYYQGQRVYFDDVTRSALSVKIIQDYQVNLEENYKLSQKK